MKCIVSGGTGFIGRRVVERLRQNDHTVTVWTRDDHAGHLTWDPLHGEPSSRSLADIDAVIHLAGEPVAQRWNEEVRARIRDSRILGTRKLVAAISRARPRPAVLVSASAIGIYGDRGDEILTESSQPGSSGFLVDVCRGWEAEADVAERLGVRVVKLRIGFVLGKDGGALAKMAPVFRAFAGGRLGSGKQWMPWIHVDDVAKMFLHAVENPVSGAWNASAPNPVTNRDFTRALARAVHRPALLPVPPFALKLGFGDFARHMLDSTRVIPEAPLKAGFEFDYPVLDKALGALQL
jgi:uncharacterized protein (TIGR01777 family)